MEGRVDIRKLTLEELVGVVSIYPWYSGARRELCARMSRMGEEALSDRQFADAALHMPSRRILADIVRRSMQQDWTDAEVEDIKEHDYYIITSEVPATCEEKGSTVEYACRSCNRHVESEDIPAIGHEYVWGEKGTVRCVNCGLFESEGGVACRHFCHNKTTFTEPGVM